MNDLIITFVACKLLKKYSSLYLKKEPADKVYEP